MYYYLLVELIRTSVPSSMHIHRPPESKGHAVAETLAGAARALPVVTYVHTYIVMAFPGEENSEEGEEE